MRVLTILVSEVMRNRVQFALATVLVAVGLICVGGRANAEGPPQRPTGLRVVAKPGSLQVAADWNDVDGATHYMVRWRAAGPGNKLNTGLEVQSSRADISLADYGEWVVRVEACNDAGCGPRGAQRFAVEAATEPAPEPTPMPTVVPTPTPSPRLTPGKPIGLTATSSALDGTVRLSWNIPVGGVPVTGYRVLRRIPGSEHRLSALIDISGKDSTSHTDATVQRRTNYIYRLQALSGNKASEMSARVQVSVPGIPKPGKPIGLAASWYGEGGEDSQSHLIALTWKAPIDGGQVTGYRILRRAPDLGEQKFKVQNGNTRSTGTIFYDPYTIRYGTRYIYLVQALNGEEPGRMSDPLEFTTPSLLTIPKLAAITASDGTVMLTWDAPVRWVTGYRIWRRAPDSKKQIHVLVSNTNSAATTHNDKTAQSGTKYIYRVQALRGDEVGELSQAAQVITPRSSTEPTLAAAAVFDGTVALTWNAPSGGETVTGYRILRRAPGLGERQLKLLASGISSATTTHKDITAKNGTEYIYRVQALRGEEQGEMSRPVRVVTASVSEELGRVAYAIGHPERGLNLIAWDYLLDFEVSGYRLLRSESGGATIVLAVMRTTRKAGPTYIDKAVRPGVTYTYWVQVISGDRIGPKSEAIRVTAR